MSGAAASDQWARWLLERRQGGTVVGDDLQRELDEYRQAVLRGAEIGGGDVLLDVGCGDGLVGLGAVQLVGAGGMVIFSDISATLLTVCRARTEALGVVQRCRFVEARAEDLAPIDDASVDAVTTRSVLIYITAKAEALRSMHRVLRPGGRLSMFEPVNSWGHPEPSDLFWGWDVGAVPELRDRVMAAYHYNELPGQRAMVDFTERDLVALVEEADFEAIEVVVRYVVKAPPVREWSAVLHSAPNPLAPTLTEAVAEALSPTEADHFLATLRLSVERRHGRRRLATAHVRARKPLAAL